MPTGNHSKKSDLKEAPRARHRTKPKFDIPVETAPAEPSVGWVYRAELEEVVLSPPQSEVATPVITIPAAASPDSEKAGPAKKTSSRDPFVMVGEGLFLIGLGAMTLVLRAASEFVVAPARMMGMLRRR